MKLIQRHDYLQKMIDAIATADIKVITGIRRSGKSKLLEAFMEYVLENDELANVIHVNFNLITSENLAEYHALNTYVEKSYMQGKNNYLLIDEVQMCKGFEKAINSFHTCEKYNIYITGSNAFLLGNDLATLFTGRTFRIEVFPFSFTEYLDYFADGNTNNPEADLDEYTKVGGMAGSYLYRNTEERYHYVADVFDMLVLRDIRQKYRIKNPDLLMRLSDFMMDNIANITSAKSIANALTNSNLPTNDKTVGAYIDHLCQAFAFYKIRRFDIRGKKYLSSGDKYYLCDHSFRYAKLGTRNMDYGRIYENIVAIELIRRGYEVYAGLLYSTEIDFVAVRGSEKLYIQVSDNISDEKTFAREYASLLKINDAYPKIILARTGHDTYSYEGIRIHDLAQWLLSK